MEPKRVRLEGVRHGTCTRVVVAADEEDVAAVAGHEDGDGDDADQVGAVEKKKSRRSERSSDRLASRAWPRRRSHRADFDG